MEPRNHLPDDEDLTEWHAQIHGLRALGQLKAEEAIPAIPGMLHQIDDEDDDWIGEDNGLPHLMKPSRRFGSCDKRFQQEALARFRLVIELINERRRYGSIGVQVRRKGRRPLHHRVD